MAATAPHCNVTVTVPIGLPTGPKGFRTIPTTATLQQVIQIVNDNFSPQIQDDEFNRRLTNDIKGVRTGERFTTRPSNKGQIPKEIDNKLGKMFFTQQRIIRRKYRVTNPEDESQYVIDDRVIGLIMKDRSGAQWVWNDPNVGENGQPAGNPQTTNSGDGTRDNVGSGTRTVSKGA